MPHVLVKLWPGKSEEQKTRIAELVTNEVMSVLNYGEESVSVAMEGLSPVGWREKVYRPDTAAQSDKLYEKPGYNPLPAEECYWRSSAHERKQRCKSQE